MRKILNKLTINIFGVECYPNTGVDTYVPTFRSIYPEGYDPNSNEGFNSWAMNIHTSLRTK